jgi:DNA-binding transcriptional ArsR family regulator
MPYDDLYKAFADEHRREIVSALCETPCPSGVVAGELARRVGLAPNALSFHLKWLRSAGLIAMQRRGRHLWYHLNAAALDAWREHVNGAFRARPTHDPASISRVRPAPPDLAETGADAPEPDLPSELL